MTYAKDLTGMRFGRLTVLSRNYEKQQAILKETGRNEAYWNCLCDCGNTTVVSGSNLKYTVRSCGCLQKESIHKPKNRKNIKWEFNGDTTIGITNKGEKFTIDTEDYEKVKDYCWRIDKNGYVEAYRRNSGVNSIVKIHRIIMGVDGNANLLIDHKDWDKTNNCKSNLRICTKSENNINIRRKSNNTSGYTGVHFDKRTKKYKAAISKNNKKYCLGTFSTIEEAVKARHEAELTMHKEWSGEINRKDFGQFIR